MCHECQPRLENQGESTESARDSESSAMVVETKTLLSVYLDFRNKCMAGNQACDNHWGNVLDFIYLGSFKTFGSLVTQFQIPRNPWEVSPRFKRARATRRLTDVVTWPVIEDERRCPILEDGNWVALTSPSSIFCLQPLISTS